MSEKILNDDVAADVSLSLIAVQVKLYYSLAFQNRKEVLALLFRMMFPSDSNYIIHCREIFSFTPVPLLVRVSVPSPLLCYEKRK
jgi:hypothetical protein